MSERINHHQQVLEAQNYLSSLIGKYGDTRIRRPQIGIRVLGFSNDETTQYGYTVRSQDGPAKPIYVLFSPDAFERRSLGPDGVKVTMRSDRRRLKDGQADGATGVIIAVPPRIMMSTIFDVLKSEEVEHLCNLVNVDMHADIDGEDLRQTALAIRHLMTVEALPFGVHCPGTYSLRL